MQKFAAYIPCGKMILSASITLPARNGRVGATGMRLGGYLAHRCALDSWDKATMCYIATNRCGKMLGKRRDDSLAEAGGINVGLAMVSQSCPGGFLTTIQCVLENVVSDARAHAPPDGRDLIRETLYGNGVMFRVFLRSGMDIRIVGYLSVCCTMR